MYSIIRIKKSIDHFISTLKQDEKNELLPELKKDLDKQIENFTQLKQELDATNVFLVCFGSVKSGKSTLLNALAKKYISPTKSGMETTLHASVILRADEKHKEGIYLYSLKPTKEAELEEEAKLESEENTENRNIIQDFKSAASNLLLYIKGAKKDLPDEFEDSNVYSINGFDVDSKTSNLEYILTEQNPDKLPGNTKNFLLAEIRINVEEGDSSLLAPGHDVVLIDMPGIDGAMAQSDTNWMRKEFLHQLPNDSHCYLYVHSSIAALTSDMAKNLKDWLGAHGRGKLLYLAFNKFDAKPWVKQSFQDKELDKAAREVEGKLRNNFPGVGIISFSLNAAMAWEGCRGNTAIDETALENGRNKDAIYAESKITDLYEALSKNLKNEKDSTIYTPIIAAVKQTVNHILELCDGCWEKEIKNQTDKLTEKRNKLDDEEKEIEERINKIINNGTSALQYGLNDKYDSIAGII